MTETTTTPQVPPFGDKRKAAMAVYSPPFMYRNGYIFDSQHLMVADNGGINDTTSVEGAVAARVRGWGRLGYLPNGAELQDEIGQMMADALNALYANIAQPVPEQGKRQPLTCVWTDEDDDSMPGTYSSACGDMWSFTDGGVAENNVRFCQGCGKAVEVHGITATPQGKI